MIRLICSVILLSSLISCATAPGDKVLEQRSDYLSDLKVLDLGYDTPKTLPKRNGEMALVWRYETKLPSGDYFWGGWVSLVVNPHAFSIEKKKK
jgi:hypothetical protein